MEPLNWRATRDLLAGVDDNPKKCSDNNNNNAKKRWNFALSKVSASRTNNRRSSEDDSQCTGATSKMTDSTASAAIALPQKFARAARSSISRSKIKGGVGFDNTSQDDDYHPTKDDHVEAWMINPQSPIDTIDEHLAAGNNNNSTAPTVDGEQSTKKIINPQQRILQEKEETIVTLRTQLNYERRGFAIMAMKFKEEKDNMSSQIRDLSWKATLRGKKLSRLEKIVDKCLLLDDTTPKKDLGGIKQTSAVTDDDNDTMDHSTQEVMMNEESVNNRIELLNAEFDRLKISRDEITSKYHDLSQTVQMKYNQLELEIATFKDMVENLNRFDMLHPTAYGCLFESLNQLGKVKDDLCNLIDYRVVLQSSDESLSSVKMMSDHLNSISKVEKRLDDDSDTISPGTESTGATTADTEDMLIFR
eukprot:scaffold81052_cov43-Cyclotella_meneghiniana.AAC.2